MKEKTANRIKRILARANIDKHTIDEITVNFIKIDGSIGNTLIIPVKATR